MRYEYKCDMGLGIVTLYGLKRFQDAKDTWENIRQSIQKDALNDVLIFDKSISALNPFEIIDLENILSHIAFPHEVKIAIVDEKEESKTDNWLGETVARNRGWYNISVFRDEESARKWLCAER